MSGFPEGIVLLNHKPQRDDEGWMGTQVAVVGGDGIPLGVDFDDPNDWWEWPPKGGCCYTEILEEGTPLHGLVLAMRMAHEISGVVPQALVDEFMELLP